LKEPDEVSEVAREHRPDESEKSALMLSKSSETRGGLSRAFEPITIDGLFVATKTFYSIVVVVLLHVSTSARVLKKSTAYHKADSGFRIITLPSEDNFSDRIKEILSA
jgi:hypothetical protein